MSEIFTQIMGGQKPEDRVLEKFVSFAPRKAIWGVERCPGRQDVISQTEDSPSERGLWGGDWDGVGECLATAGPSENVRRADGYLPLAGGCSTVNFFRFGRSGNSEGDVKSGIIFCIPGIVCQWLLSGLSGYYFQVSKGFGTPRHES